MKDVAFLAPGGASGELAAVGHYYLDGVVAGMDILFHRLVPVGVTIAPIMAEFAGSIHEPNACGKPRRLTAIGATRH
jgi:hypothetical protein